MKKSSSLVLVASVVSLMSMALAATVGAAPLAPGLSLVPLDEPGPTGATLLATETAPFIGADIQGSVISKVYSGDVDNLLGGLTFTYEIVSSLSVQDISTFTVGNYGGFLTDVSYSSVPGFVPIVPPSLSSRSSGVGDVVRFHFITPALSPGLSSALLVVQTDAHVYASTIASVINAGSAEVASLAPTPVPEPAAAALIGFGLLALAGVVRRRR